MPVEGAGRYRVSVMRPTWPAVFLCLCRVLWGWRCFPALISPLISPVRGTLPNLPRRGLARAQGPAQDHTCPPAP